MLNLAPARGGINKNMAKNKKEELEEIPQAEADVGEVLAGWEIPEFTKPSRKKQWYLYFSIIMAALLIYAYFERNLFFAVIIVLFLIIYIVLERRQPEQVTFAITEDGIVIGRKFIEYQMFDSFHIIYYPPEVKNLYLVQKNMLKPLINVPFLDENPAEVRKILLEYLPEDLEKEEKPPSESVGDLFKL